MNDDIHAWYLYLITDGSGHCKIGATVHEIKRRLQTLQCGNPRRLTALSVIRVKNRSIALLIEKRLLLGARRHRVGGEWLRVEAAPALRWFAGVVAKGRSA